MIPYVDEIKVRGKTVFLRVDLNVPLSRTDGSIEDDTRIQAALPTMRYLLDEGARLVLCSHLGRPKGERSDALSLAPVGALLAELLNREVVLVDEIIGEGAQQMIRHGRKDAVFLLENVRFYPGEKKNDRAFAQALAALADVYVTDAFGTAHRKHASTYGVPEIMSEVAAGFLVKKEVRCLDNLIYQPASPFVVVAGGAKVTDKLGAIENLINHVDKVVIGGAMAYAFLAAKGQGIGKSKCEEAGVAAAEAILKKASVKNVEILLPTDHVIAVPEDDADLKQPRVSDVIPTNAMALDIGPQTAKRFAQVVSAAKTIFWNGPQGFFEREEYLHGTRVVGEAIAQASAFKVAGGGDTVSAVKILGLQDKFDLISTGGGASLEYLEGSGLPGLLVLDKKRQGNIPTSPEISLEEDQ